MPPTTRNPVCATCGINRLQHARAALGYTVCLTCGEADARARKHTVVPLHKSAYTLITDPLMLRQLDPKRSGV